MGWKERDLTAFWAMMRETYGARWVESYGDRVNTSWRRSLETVTPEEARRGLDYLRRTTDGRYVPTLIEFEHAISEALKSQPAAHASYEKLPSPPREGRMRLASEWAKKARITLGVEKQA